METMKIGVLGSGQVAKVLAAGFLKHGHDVMVGSRDPGKLDEWKTKSVNGLTGTFEEAATFGDIIVLAVKGTAAEELIKSLKNNLVGKIVMDATNPIAEVPPVNGVLQFFTTYNDSLMERLQKISPESKFVKVYNSVGNSLMVNPSLPSGRPTMFICGNDEEAKRRLLKYSICLDGRQLILEKWNQPGLLSPCVCFGVYQGSSETSGHTHLSS